MSEPEGQASPDAERAGRGWLARLRDPRVAGALKVTLTLAIVAIAVVALHGLSREVKPADVMAALRATTPAQIGLSLLFTAVSFVALAIYDVIATRSIAPGRVPVAVAAATGAAGYAVSNLLGFALVTGGALRARVYAGRGLDIVSIGGVLATAVLTFYGGMAVLGGGILVLEPGSIAGVTGISPLLLRGFGVLLLLLVASVFAWLATGRRTVPIGGRHLPLPSPRMALAQVATALLDFAAAAAALYALMPEGVVPGPGAFVIAFSAAMILAVISHAPGGVGVFDVTLLALLGAAGKAGAIAALLLYRLIYYVLPFAVTALALGLLWLRAHHAKIGKAGEMVSRALDPLVPAIGAGLATLSGLVLLVGGGFAADPDRLALLRRVLPLGLVEAAHAAGAVFGIVLLVAARGLWRRRQRAWTVAMTALGLGASATLAKGLAWEETALLALGIVALGAFRSAFDRPAGVTRRVTPVWALGAGLVVAGSVWLGVAAFQPLPYDDDLWWRVAWDGDTSRTLRAALAAGATLLGLTVASAVRRPAEDVSGGADA